MKKLISFVMAAVLCVGMTTTVLADGSPVISGDIQSTIKEVESDATDVKVKTFEEAKESYTEAEKAAVEKVADNSGVLAEVQKLYSGVTALEKVVKFDLEATGAGTFKFKVDGINKGDAAVVLHFTNGAWTDMKAQYDDEGNLVVFFDGNYSPVMIVKFAEATATADSDPETTSPKTADVAMFGLYAAVALAGTVTAARKAKASK